MDDMRERLQLAGPPPAEVEHDPLLVKLLEQIIVDVKRGRIDSVLVIGASPSGQSFNAFGNVLKHTDTIMAEFMVVQHRLVCFKEQSQTESEVHTVEDDDE